MGGRRRADSKTERLELREHALNGVWLDRCFLDGNPSANPARSASSRSEPLERFAVRLDAQPRPVVDLDPAVALVS